MKTCIVNSALALSCLFFMDLSAETSKPLPVSKDTRDEIIIKDQTDATDIYAIPLDDSEIEDEEEFEMIRRREKEYLEKHPNQK